MNTLAVGLGCQVELEHITRCTTPGAVMSDALSKGHFLRFWEVARSSDFKLPLDMAWVPRSLMEWVMDPKEDFKLGFRILQEISPYAGVLSTVV